MPDIFLKKKREKLKWPDRLSEMAESFMSQSEIEASKDRKAHPMAERRKVYGKGTERWKGY